MRLLLAQVFGQPLIGRAPKVSIQQAVQFGFQPPGGHRQVLARRQREAQPGWNAAWPEAK